MSPPIQSATKTRRCTRHPVPGDELREPRAQPASCSLGFAGRRNGTQLPAGRVLQLRATAPTRVRLRGHPQPAACSSGSELGPGGWEKTGRVGDLPWVKLRIAFDSRGQRLRNALAVRGRRKSVGESFCPPGACSPHGAGPVASLRAVPGPGSLPRLPWRGCEQATGPIGHERGFGPLGLRPGSPRELPLNREEAQQRALAT